MKTEIYNKVHQITQETEKVKEATVKLEVETEKLEDAKRVIEKLNAVISGELEIFAKLNNEINSTAEIMVPLVRDYVRNIQEIRMAIGREVIEIIRSVREINSVTKMTPDIDKLCVSISMLSKVVKDNSDISDNLKKIFNIKNESENNS